MARSDQLRAEVARWQGKKAGYAKGVAKHEKAAASAREAAREVPGPPTSRREGRARRLLHKVGWE